MLFQQFGTGIYKHGPDSGFSYVLGLAFMRGYPSIFDASVGSERICLGATLPVRGPAVLTLWYKLHVVITAGLPSKSSGATLDKVFRKNDFQPQLNRCQTSE